MFDKPSAVIELENMKQKVGEALILWRVADGFEAYENDARYCTEVLGIKLEHGDGYKAGVLRRAKRQSRAEMRLAA